MGPKAHTTKDAMASKICILYSENGEDTHIYFLANRFINILLMCYRDIAAEEVYIVP